MINSGNSQKQKMAIGNMIWKMIAKFISYEYLAEKIIDNNDNFFSTTDKKSCRRKRGRWPFDKRGCGKKLKGHVPLCQMANGMSMTDVFL